MPKISNLYVECYIDTMLITALGFPPNPVHQSNGHVIKSVMNCKIKSVGIIDKDKVKNVASNLRKFKLEEADINNNLEFYVFENRSLVKVCRDVEYWLWHCNEQLDPSISFPYDSVKELKKFTKNERTRRDAKIINFINKLVQKNPPAIHKLREYLYEHFGNQY